MINGAEYVRSVLTEHLYFFSREVSIEVICLFLVGLPYYGVIRVLFL